ncbi:MAG TPA: nucleotidyltransferase family protein [Candidatus Kryptonia bacterium]|nr:nucleotidyltransferase family protein [Candidatus Kryptonia bacterium]
MIRAMILAAGLGTRLRPLTDHAPKPLLDVGGRPMIAYPLLLLRSAGIAEVLINLHHLGAQIRRALGDGSDYSVRITYSEEDPILDTGGAIKNAEAFLRGDTFVIANADTIVDLDLPAMLAFHRARGGISTMLLRDDPDVQRYGAIEVDAGDRVRRFLGIPPVVNAPLTALMYGGVWIFEPRVFQYMQPGVYSVAKRTAIDLLQAGEALYGYRYEGYWRVLDTPDGLEAGRRELQTTRLRFLGDA